MKAVQSAMAIRRQRRRRDEALRAKTRRASHQSDHLMLSDSGDAGSLMSLDGAHHRSTSHRHRQMMGGITTFHVGVVFFIMGLMLLISGLVPGYANRQHQYWEEGGGTTSVSNSQTNNRNGPLLLVTGSFLILVGVALVVANRIATRREDELFSRYISRKLAPARMTHQPVSSLLPAASAHQQQQHTSHKSNGKKEQTEEDRVLSEEEHAVQSPGQLESITEEAEIGSERASKDQLFWTSDVAPVHHHHHHHHHHTKSVHQDKCDQHSHPHDNHHGSSTG
ncbi:uncharacterized protein LOC130688586 isoform X1 [Daphnia carinata]|uniref:uncharacterized protein LOC130688586 isoform X1 n=1 Tax=Daphnia carinata TaxID=120202 RepID=UPI00257EC43F|nr:uncharacterized protein LOC130688586 isoform X1 [Daphnia carinata]XP_057367559.1 uncharacterized protein LOC130688586 isoform X1 [Daphnia carinata]